MNYLLRAFLERFTRSMSFAALGRSQDLGLTPASTNRFLVPQLSLADLVAKITQQNSHVEVETGKAVGNEVW